MENISSLLITIILLGVLVIAHEFGHFIIAKKNGIWVQEFAVGMGPKIFSRTKGDTEYSIRILPLGGFCRMEGEAEDGASSSTSFLSKSVGARMAVMAAGPVMNFLLAFLMIFGLTCTTYTATPVIKEVLPDSAAAASGLEVGDRIQKIDGKTIHIYDELQYTLQSNHGESLTLEETLRKYNDFSKVYIMLGYNELGWPYPEEFIKYYAKVLDIIKEANPAADIYVECVIPVARTITGSGDDPETENNENIARFNRYIREMCKEQKVYFLNVQEALVDSEGYLPDGAASDGIHMKKEYCIKWLDYIRCHVVSNQ